MVQTLETPSAPKLAYSVKEAAPVIGISEKSLYEELKKPDCWIPSRKIGTRIIIPIAALEKTLAEVRGK